MAVVMSMKWREVTPDLYDEARRRVRWEEETAEGAVSHVAWFAQGEFHVIDVWESEEHFRRFVEDRLMPVVKGELGIEREPHVVFHEAHRHFAIPQATVA